MSKKNKVVPIMYWSDKIQISRIESELDLIVDSYRYYFSLYTLKISNKNIHCDSFLNVLCSSEK